MKVPWNRKAAVVSLLSLSFVLILIWTLMNRNQEQNTDSVTEIVETEAPIAYQPFSNNLLRDSLKQNRFVLVIFSGGNVALTKHHFALDKSNVRQFIDEHRIVPLIATFDDDDPEMVSLMESAGDVMLPIVFLYSPGRPQAPIHLQGYDEITNENVMAMLHQVVK